MKAAVLLLFLTVLLTFPSASQQLPQHMPVHVDARTVQSAWTGSGPHDSHTVAPEPVDQLEGGPVVTFAHVEMPLSMVGIRGGAGLSVASDKARPNREYSYRLIRLPRPPGKGTLDLG